ncbi:Scytalone dehydratase [Cercospora beticola]|uniref:Scytalone dehydratase n=1 Tax=Cercospora beticola TaxID=122368 RepID=A0A2G5I2W8_CERBT|nr:Scytalone dehydratase [Cercospora beticola]PIA99166.1 Scytalone dehydratase [Cercospora beticola]WPA99645.1 hypothetical protein RHO25_004263 [Cercospora beticola]CAK1362214.1 unnamed protein product [Cercospora beticola]
MATAELPAYPSYNDVLGCQEALFEWAESFDSKNWKRLDECLAPTLYVDYREVMGPDHMGPAAIWEAMPKQEFIDFSSSPGFLGNPRIQTQHFVGGCIKWKQTAEEDIEAHHQMRVAHARYKDDECKEVEHKGHVHGWAFTRYKKVGGVWKLAGVGPDLRWYEFNYEKIFG